MIQGKGYYFLVKLLFIVCLLLYNFQGTLLPLGSPVCTTAVSIVMVMEIVCFIASIKKIGSPIFVTIFLLLLLTLLAFTVSESQVEIGRGRVVRSLSELLAITYNCLFLFTGYHLYRKSVFQDRDVLFILLLLLIQSIISYFYTKNLLLVERGYFRYTNNIGYAFACLLPFVFFLKRKTYQWLIIITIYVFALLCAKRGAVIVSSLFIIYFLFCSVKESKHTVASAATAIIAIVLVAFLSLWIYSGNEYLQMRWESTMEGESSNRDVLYSSLWAAYINFDNIFQYLFGRGLLTSVKITGSLAHNDWLEILVSSGLIGVIVYLSFFIQLIRYTQKATVSSWNKRIVISIFIIWFTKTLFSMAISDVMFAPIPLLLGIAIARNEKEKQNSARYQL